jgi:3-methyladenine DNA glycosylase AlkC
MEDKFLLKNMYSPAFYDSISKVLTQTLPAFDQQKFLENIFVPAFAKFELKERMSHTAKVLHTFLPENFEEASSLLLQFIENLQQAGIKENTIEFMFLPEYIALYGLAYYEASVKAMEKITQFTSCEFAVRPFLLKYEDKMTEQMLAWSKHSHRKVRRLASEGIRPRLPWAIALPALKKNPTPILPILENLKQDTCEVVRRSVANNLNDISKDNPATVIQIVEAWKGLGAETDAIIKHACRTLLKQANPDILKYYGLDSQVVKISDFQIFTPKVKIGDSLHFSFEVSHLSDVATTIRLEYGVYYLRQNGTLSRKVFKISERIFAPQEKAVIERNQSFRIITTRQFYVGKHQLSLIVNGEEKAKEAFELL